MIMIPYNNRCCDCSCFHAVTALFMTTSPAVVVSVAVAVDVDRMATVVMIVTATMTAAVALDAV